MDKGDFLLLALDGLFEAECTGRTQFGIEGIEEYLYEYSGYDLLNNLVTKLYKKSKYVEFLDDVSMIKIEPCETQT